MRTTTVVGEGHQGQGRVVHRDRPDQGSRAVDQGTEEHYYGRGTRPGHARLVVAGVAQGGGSGSVHENLILSRKLGTINAVPVAFKT